MIPRISLGFPDFSWGCRRGGGAAAVYRARRSPNLCRVWHGILQAPLHAAASPTRARGTWPLTSGIQPGVSWQVSAVGGPPPRVSGHAAHRTHAIADAALCMRRCARQQPRCARHQPRPGAANDDSEESKTCFSRQFGERNGGLSSRHFTSVPPESCWPTCRSCTCCSSSKNNIYLVMFDSG